MTTDQDKQQAIEDYFRYLGMEIPLIHRPEIAPKYYEAVDIIDHFPSFKKWVLEKMEGEGYRLDIGNNYAARLVTWLPVDGFDPYKYIHETIINNEITLAAVKAATRYWREKNAEGS